MLMSTMELIATQFTETNEGLRKVEKLIYRSAS
jgi:hypothetical protein